MTRPRLAALSGALLSAVLALPAAAHAGDPIMPLGDVHAGMRCTGLSVIRGTDIASFDVEVLDVVAGDGEPQILVRVSGPAVDETGIAEGFSGSPVQCPDAAGVPRTIGAIAEGTGDYGNKVVLVTPIELMLGEPVDPPASARAASRALVRTARPLAVPLSFGGVSGPVADALRTAARKTGRALYAAPAAPRAAFPPQQLRPGSSVAVGLAGGAITAGAVGTVTYVDGGRVWAFGHPLDGAGRRSLLLQDAYVYAVIGNPLDTQDTTSYKLAAPGHDLGTLTNDAPDGVVGRLGALPARFPLRITSTDLDSGRVARELVEVADENAIGLPTGSSALTQVAPVAVAQAAYDILRGSPSQQSGEMCMRITIRERRRPLRFCNTYVGGSPSAAGAPLVADVADAAGRLDAYKLGVLHVTSVDVNLKLRRDLHQAYMLRLRGPSVVRRGSDVRVRVTAQRVRGARFTRSVRVHVPRDLAAGTHELVLTGAPADGGGPSDSSSLSGVFEITLDGSGSGSSDTRGPASVAALARGVAGIARENGVTAHFRDPGDTSADTATRDVLVLRDRGGVRLSGSAKLTLDVRPERRPKR